MAVGNTFGATALSSYGGFWLSFAIVLTPGGFDIEAAYKEGGFDDALGIFLLVSFSRPRTCATRTLPRCNVPQRS